MKKEYLKFEDRNDIVRDSYSKAIINKDVAGYHAALKRKNNKKRLDKLEEDVGDIKNMITLLIERISKEENK